jgi:lipoprotein-anchoring transpeptidase ErfK/SrfK
VKKLFFTILLICATGVAFLWLKPKQTETVPSISIETPPPIIAPPQAPVPEKELQFKNITLTSDKPGVELTEAVGFENVSKILAINRIDDKHLWKGLTMVIPTKPSYLDNYSFMPEKIEAAENIPKLIVISQHMQSFGLYEKGQLVRSGPVSTGKQATPTKSQLYYTNWKGKEVVSTFDDEWILKWNFNIDNNEGISLHQYALPGYPASHSCVRFYGEDAEWIFNWADQWILAKDGQHKIANGTPVIVFGNYDFARTAPWKNLPTNESATTISQDEIEEIVLANVDQIEHEQILRNYILTEN